MGGLYTKMSVGDMQVVIPKESSPLAAIRMFGTDVKRFTVEDALAEKLEEAGITGLRRHYGVSLPGRRAMLDFGFPEQKIDVEVDGYEHSHEKRIVKRDRQRDECLKAAGWTVIRLSTGQVVREPEACVELIRTTLQKSACVLQKL